MNHRPNFCDYVPYDYEAEGGEEEEDLTETDRLKSAKKIDQSRRRGWTVPTGVGLRMGGSRRTGMSMSMSIQEEDESNVSVDVHQHQSNLRLGGQSHLPLARVVTPERYKGSDSNNNNPPHQGGGGGGGGTSGGRGVSTSLSPPEEGAMWSDVVSMDSYSVQPSTSWKASATATASGTGSGAGSGTSPETETKGRISSYH